MNVRRLQGMALIVSAVCLLLGLFGPQSISFISPQAATFYLATSLILFMLWYLAKSLEVALPHDATPANPAAIAARYALDVHLQSISRLTSEYGLRFSR